MASSPDVVSPLRASATNTSRTEDVWESQEEQRRVNASLSASSDVVKALFGASVGPCWGDFFCTYNRIRGRLYATSQAILFYTNLLGFERRICLIFREIVHMELYRNTSIRISTVDCETYVFRSFNDRQQVLHLLNGLKVLADKHASRQRAFSSSSGLQLAEERENEENHLDPLVPLTTLRPTVSASAYAGVSPLAVENTNRRRAVSDSVVRVETSDTSPPSLPEIRLDRADSLYVREEESSPVNIQNEVEPSPQEQWEKVKQSNVQPLEHVGVDSLVLPCSLDQFYTNFLADDAPFSLDRYQRDHIQDRNVEITGWDVGPEVWNRTVTFTHPIQNSMGIGPSEARTTRKQRLRRFGQVGICLENTTRVEGVPSSDAFYVQDQWLVEAMGDNQICLTTRYATRFTKRALFKSVIQKSINKETKDWFTGYVKMLERSLEKDTTAAPLLARSPAEEAMNVEAVVLALKDLKRTVYQMALVGILLLFLVLMVTILQLVSMREAMLALRNEVEHLKLENAQVVCLDPVVDVMQGTED